MKIETAKIDDRPYLILTAEGFDDWIKLCQIRNEIYFMEFVDYLPGEYLSIKLDSIARNLTVLIPEDASCRTIADKIEEE
jgi:hypothetical protein